MKTPFFPIDMDTFNAEVSFEIHKPGDKLELCESKISLYQQEHPGSLMDTALIVRKNQWFIPPMPNTRMRLIPKSIPLLISFEVLTS